MRVRGGLSTSRLPHRCSSEIFTICLVFPIVPKSELFGLSPKNSVRKIALFVLEKQSGPAAGDAG